MSKSSRQWNQIQKFGAVAGTTTMETSRPRNAETVTKPMKRRGARNHLRPE
jgi:hypothetical protein